jgi:hypothetical protein
VNSTFNENCFLAEKGLGLKTMLKDCVATYHICKGVNLAESKVVIGINRFYIQ